MKQRIDFALQPVSLGPNFIAFAVDVPVQPCKNGEIGPFTRKTTTSDGTTALTYYKLTDDFAKTRRSHQSLQNQAHRTGGHQMKKILEDMIIKWHQAGYSLDEIAPLVPQVPKAEVAAIIRQHDKEARL